MILLIYILLRGLEIISIKLIWLIMLSSQNNLICILRWEYCTINTFVQLLLFSTIMLLVCCIWKDSKNRSKICIRSRIHIISYFYNKTIWIILTLLLTSKNPWKNQSLCFLVWASLTELLVVLCVDICIVSNYF